VREAVAALAATFETASRGVIYEHRPASLPAERLMSQLKPMLAEAGKGSGSSFERDAAVVLRRVEDATREARALEPENRRVWLETVGRVIAKTPPTEQQPATAPPEEPRLIIP
jgi:class 3 adenylate cyclase